MYLSNVQKKNKKKMIFCIMRFISLSVSTSYALAEAKARSKPSRSNGINSRDYCLVRRCWQTHLIIVLTATRNSSQITGWLSIYALFAPTGPCGICTIGMCVIPVDVSRFTVIYSVFYDLYDWCDHEYWTANRELQLQSTLRFQLLWLKIN